MKISRDELKKDIQLDLCHFTPPSADLDQSIETPQTQEMRAAEIAACFLISFDLIFETIPFKAEKVEMSTRRAFRVIENDIESFEHFVYKTAEYLAFELKKNYKPVEKFLDLAFMASSIEGQSISDLAALRELLFEEIDKTGHLDFFLPQAELNTFIRSVGDRVSLPLSKLLEKTESKSERKKMLLSTLMFVDRMASPETALGREYFTDKGLKMEGYSLIASANNAIRGAISACIIYNLLDNKIVETADVIKWAKEIKDLRIRTERVSKLSGPIKRPISTLLPELKISRESCMNIMVLTAQDYALSSMTELKNSEFEFNPDYSYSRTLPFGKFIFIDSTLEQEDLMIFDGYFHEATYMPYHPEFSSNITTLDQFTDKSISISSSFSLKTFDDGAFGISDFFRFYIPDKIKKTPLAQSVHEAEQRYIKLLESIIDENPILKFMKGNSGYVIIKFDKQSYQIAVNKRYLEQSGYDTSSFSAFNGTERLNIKPDSGWLTVFDHRFSKDEPAVVDNESEKQKSIRKEILKAHGGHLPNYSDFIKILRKFDVTESDYGEGGHGSLFRSNQRQITCDSIRSLKTPVKKWFFYQTLENLDISLLEYLNHVKN